MCAYMGDFPEFGHMYVFQNVFLCRHKLLDILI